MEFATLPINEIFYDEPFNCRGPVTLDSVETLADSILRNGQDTPIVVQPIEDVRFDGQPSWRGSDPKWRVICGHRRFRAMRDVLFLVEIKAEIVRGLTDQEARDRNLRENLERKDLTLLEEARWLERRYPYGIPIKAACKALNKTEHWMRPRKYILDMDEKIQQAADAGLLSASNIIAIWELPKDEQRRAANALIQLRTKNPRRRSGVANILPFYKRARVAKKAGTISKMVKWMMEQGVEGLPLRVASWCAGYIDDADLKADCLTEIQKNSLINPAQNLTNAVYPS